MGGSGTAQLTEEQRAFVEAPAGRAIRLIAAAGSGKSHTILSRVEHLDAACGVPPEAVLVITFSRDARADLEERARGRGIECQVSTIDALAHRVLRAVDGRVDCSVSQLPARFAEAVRARPGAVRAALGGLREVYVDEAQDVSQDQYSALAGLGALGIVVSFVGDPYQSIYGFRDGDSRFFMGHPADLALSMTRSFRCTAETLRFADAIQGAPRSTSERSGPVPRVLVAAHREAIGAVVALARACAAARRRLAVLAPSRGAREHSTVGLYAVANALALAGIPFAVAGDDAAGAAAAEGAVELRTIHSSKGMEWPVVAVLDAHNDMLGLPTCADDATQQRNLLYVAFTRARDELHVVLQRREQPAHYPVPVGPHPALAAVDPALFLLEGETPAAFAACPPPACVEAAKPRTVRAFLASIGRAGRESVRACFEYRLLRETAFAPDPDPSADLYAACASGVCDRLRRVREALKHVSRTRFVACGTDRHAAALRRVLRCGSWSQFSRAARRRALCPYGRDGFDAAVEAFDPATPLEDHQPVLDVSIALLERAQASIREIERRFETVERGAVPAPALLRRACRAVEAYQSHALYRLARLSRGAADDAPPPEAATLVQGTFGTDPRGSAGKIGAAFDADERDTRCLVAFGDRDELELVLSARIVRGAPEGRVACIDARGGSRRDYYWRVVDQARLGALLGGGGGTPPPLYPPT